MDSRTNSRTRRRIPCEIEVDGRTAKGTVIDLSADGLFVQTNAAAIPKTTGELEVRILGGSGFPELTLRAELARRQLSPALLDAVVGRGVGLRIVEAPPEYHEALERLREHSECHTDDDVADATEPVLAQPQAHESGGEAPQEEPEPPIGEMAAVRPDPPRGAGSVPAAAGTPECLAMMVDEGELQDVYQVLEELGARPVRARLAGPTRFDGWESAPRVFIAAARCALSIRIPELAPNEGVVTIAVADTESQTLCALMRRLGYQYVVRRPVHPEALRLLLMRALYRESDQRSEPRFAFGHDVAWLAGWRARRGAIVEISPGGCRLFSPVAEAPGQEITLRIPRSATGASALWIRARVLRCDRLEGDRAGGAFAVALVFDEPRPKAQARLGLLLAKRSLGPATLAPASRVPPWLIAVLERLGLLRALQEPADEPAQEPVEEQRLERRRTPRGILRQEVVALDGQTARVMHVLFGRDLSPGGIRVEPHPQLRVGDQFTLAIYDASCAEPLLVDAEVVRDDGDQGLGLAFADPSRGVTEQIEQIVASLPSVESLDAPDGRSRPMVVTQVVQWQEPQGR
ncbi:MAG: PilZ domain-containing protein [Proteobacteria bacterium]|nr:PilZ domain-containing protein [Pseudomonadota bacterium]